ncbi:thioredoxin domain-containing protein [Priestia megaterium]
MNYAFINNDSSRAAEFAETVYKELGNDTFWKFHELLYKKQNAADEKKDVLTESYLEDTLKEVSSDAGAKKVASAFKDGKGKDAFDQDMKTANNLGITGTPTIYVGGKNSKEKQSMTLIKWSKMRLRRTNNEQVFGLRVDYSAYRDAWKLDV